jgi:hypothetical protein
VLALIQAGAGCAGAREDAGSLDEGSAHCWWGCLWLASRRDRNQGEVSWHFKQLSSVSNSSRFFRH